MTSPDTETTETKATDEVKDEATESKSTESSAGSADAKESAVAVAETPPSEIVKAEVVEAKVVETKVVKAEVVEEEDEEDPNTVVFSLMGFFLAYIPFVGVVVNAIAVVKAGKEGFDLFLARWGLVLAILSTIGALILVGAGIWIGLELGRNGV
jgi:hypothetical protein